MLAGLLGYEEAGRHTAATAVAQWCSAPRGKYRVVDAKSCWSDGGSTQLPMVNDSLCAAAQRAARAAATWRWLAGAHPVRVHTLAP